LPHHLEASTVHPRRTEIANADVATPTPFTLAPNNQWKILFLLIGWKLLNFTHFNCLGLFSSHSQNVVISEQSIGRQKPLNCLCEGLLVFLFFKPQVRIILNFTVHVENQVNRIYFAIFVLLHFYTNLVRKHTEVLDVVNLLALCVRFVCFCPQGSISFHGSIFDSWKRQHGSNDSFILHQFAG